MSTSVTTEPACTSAMISLAAIVDKVASTSISVSLVTVLIVAGLKSSAKKVLATLVTTNLEPVLTEKS